MGNNELHRNIEKNIAELAALAKDDKYPFAARSAWHSAQVTYGCTKLAEISTRRIVLLTWMLLWATIALLIVALREPSRTNEAIKRANNTTTQH
jgi:hypothetical protein